MRPREGQACRRPSAAAALVVVGLFLIVALAGCAKTAPAEQVDDEPTVGELRGVVVDQSIQPMAGVRVEAGELNTTTDGEGNFVFTGLEPGFYLVRAMAQSYTDAVAHVTISASEPPPVLKLVMTFDATQRLYHEGHMIEGFVECGTYTAPYRFAACGTFNVASLIVCSYTGTCMGNVTGDRYITVAWFENTPDHLQAEIVWESTQPLGDSLSVLIGSATPEQLQQVTSSVYNDTSGTSPLLVTMDAEQLADSGIGQDAYFLSQTFAARSEMMPCVAGACVGLGAVVQQEFTNFIHLFFGYEPPAGWRFTDNNSVPPPPEVPQ